MGAKPRPAKEPTLSEKFDAFFKEADTAFDTHDGRLMGRAQVAIRCALDIPPEELTMEQWAKVYNAIVMTRKLCDAVLPDLRNKIRIAETYSWLKDS
jgi:hypothetical protein